MLRMKMFMMIKTKYSDGLKKKNSPAISCEQYYLALLASFVRSQAQVIKF